MCDLQVMSVPKDRNDGHSYMCAFRSGACLIGQDSGCGFPARPQDEIGFVCHKSRFLSCSCDPKPHKLIFRCFNRRQGGVQQFNHVTFIGAVNAVLLLTRVY